MIKSHRAGVGKTLKVKRLGKDLKQVVGRTSYTGPLVITVPLHCRVINQSTVLKDLLVHQLDHSQAVPRIFHIDIAHEVCCLLCAICCVVLNVLKILSIIFKMFDV